MCPDLLDARPAFSSLRPAVHAVFRRADPARPTRWWPGRCGLSACGDDMVEVLSAIAWALALLRLHDHDGPRVLLAHRQQYRHDHHARQRGPSSARGIPDRPHHRIDHRATDMSCPREQVRRIRFPRTHRVRHGLARVVHVNSAGTCTLPVGEAGWQVCLTVCSRRRMRAR